MSGSTRIAEGDMLCLDTQLCFPLYAATNLLGRAYRPLLEPLGLTYSQYLVMLVLWESEQVYVGDLARRLYLDSGTITPLLQRMEKLGLLNRTRDTRDERRVVVRLTSDGAALHGRAAQVPATLADNILEHFGIDAARTLRDETLRLVSILSDSLDGSATGGSGTGSSFPSTP